MLQLRSQLDVQVKSNVKSAQEKQKKDYDKRHQEGSFKVGQKVLVKNMKKLSKKGDKMEINWFGPYEIDECIGLNTYRLKKQNGKGCLKVAYSSTRLKAFNERGEIDFHVTLAKFMHILDKESQLNVPATETPSKTDNDQPPVLNMPFSYSCTSAVRNLLLMYFCSQTLSGVGGM